MLARNETIFKWTLYAAATALCFLPPLIGITVAVEQDSLMLCEGLGHQLVQLIIKVYIRCVLNVLQHSP